MRSFLIAAFLLGSSATAGVAAPVSLSDKCSSNVETWWQLALNLDRSGQLYSSQSCAPDSTLKEAKQGCCSHHGGVCGCNSSTGHQLCCDGKDSPSCGC
jgi:hypothetical protein